MKEFDDVPFPEYEDEADELIALYIAMWQQVMELVLQLSELLQSPERSVLIRHQNEVNREITNVFDTVRAELRTEVSAVVTKSYTEGIAYSKYALSPTYDTLTDAKKDVVLSAFNKRKITKMITDTQSDLLKATNNTEENVKKFVRKTVATAMSSTGGRNVKKKNMADKIKAEMKKEMLKQGLEESNIAIIDKAKRRWKLDTYVKMVANTKMATAYMDGIRDQALQDGQDLAIISSHPLTVDVCNNFEGMIISLNGLTAGYLVYEELRASKLIFHPNCRHFARPVSGLNFVPQVHKDKHDKQMKKYRKWEESQNEGQSA